MIISSIPVSNDISADRWTSQGGSMRQGHGRSSIDGSGGLGGFAMTEGDTRELIDLIYKLSGIVLTPDKKTLISSRLHKRLKALELGSFGAYLDYLQNAPDRNAEIVAMTDEITTNKTAFFRERHHFDFLVSDVLPNLVRSEWSVVNIWSAGCSTGEEPYTLAMVLAEYFGTTCSFNILATDLSTRALQTAQRAVYASELGDAIPDELRQKYTLTGHGSQSGRFRIVPELRERVTFRQINFIDRLWDVPETMHIIFCRNVMIYFDKKTRTDIVARFCKNLKAYGYLFIGHSETLADLDQKFDQIRPTIYTRR